MPVVRWGIDQSDVDDYDRSRQFKPYRGKIPPNAVYDWEVKVLKYAAGTREKNPQLIVGLELVPRDSSEDKYAGYFIMDYIPVMNKTQFRYVPLLDALGISGRDFATRTKVDTDGKILKVGRWVLDGHMVSAQLVDGEDQKGNPRKEIKGGAYFECLEPEEDEDDEYAEDDEDAYDGDDDVFDDDDE
jgi:hypothetical protein